MVDKAPSPNQYKPFMTEVSGRRPKVKIHTSIGHAKNALLVYGSRYNCVRGGKLYQWDIVAGDWVLLYDIPANTPETKVPWRSRG